MFPASVGAAASEKHNAGNSSAFSYKFSYPPGQDINPFLPWPDEVHI